MNRRRFFTLLGGAALAAAFPVPNGARAKTASLSSALYNAQLAGHRAALAQDQVSIAQLQAQTDALACLTDSLKLSAASSNANLSDLVQRLEACVKNGRRRS